MRNADYDQDPRGWSDRPSPAGRSRRRSACRARLDNGPGSRQTTRRSTRGRCLQNPVRDPLFYARGITPQSSSRSLVPPVPDFAEMAALLLEAAQEHFTAGRYAAAEAFLKLIRVPDMDPATTWQQLGQLHFSLADYESAGRAYGYAAAYDPRDYLRPVDRALLRAVPPPELEEVMSLVTGRVAAQVEHLVREFGAAGLAAEVT